MKSPGQSGSSDGSKSIVTKIKRENEMKEKEKKDIEAVNQITAIQKKALNDLMEKREK